MSRFNKKQAAIKNRRPKRFSNPTVILIHPDGMVAAQMQAQKSAKLESTMGPGPDARPVIPADETAA